MSSFKERRTIWERERDPSPLKEGRLTVSGTFPGVPAASSLEGFGQQCKREFAR